MLLRITGGELRGRRFGGPRGDGTRPTAEKVREAIGSALASRGLLEGARVLDLFAGTGALAFEALSRGAREAVLVERDRAADRTIRESARSLGLEARTDVRRLDLAGRPEALAASLARGAPFDLVFADPPYEEIDRVPPLLVALDDAGLLAADAVAVVEHAARRAPRLPPNLAILADYRYGDTAVALLMRAERRAVVTRPDEAERRASAARPDEAERRASAARPDEAERRPSAARPDEAERRPSAARPDEDEGPE